MAIGTPHSLYSAASTVTAQPTHTFTLTSGAAVGERVWAFFAMECGDTTPAVPTWNTTDSKGNTWTVFRAPLRNGGGTGGTAMIYGSTCVVTTALAAGDTVSINNPNADFSPTRIALCIAAASGVDVIDQQATSDPGSTASLSVGPVTTTTNEQIIWGWWASGVRAFTQGTNFTKMAELASTAGTSDRQLSLEYRIVTSTGSYSATGSLATATTVVGGMSTWKAAVVPVTQTGVYILNGSGIWEPANTTLL